MCQLASWLTVIIPGHQVVRVHQDPARRWAQQTIKTSDPGPLYQRWQTTGEEQSGRNKESRFLQGNKFQQQLEDTGSPVPAEDYVWYGYFKLWPHRPWEIETRRGDSQWRGQQQRFPRVLWVHFPQILRRRRPSSLLSWAKRGQLQPGPAEADWR